MTNDSTMMTYTRLFYIYDPMCSWCYAFSSSLTGLHKDLPSAIDIFYLLGGLAPDTTQPMSVDLQETIQQTWQRIEQTIPAIHFNYDFWKLNTPFRSTYPACRAVLAARKQDAHFEIKMLHAIQEAYYQLAKNPSLRTPLEECATKVGLNTVKFMKDMASPWVENELQREIKLARRMGISSYPSLCLVHKEKQHLIAVEYLHHQSMINKINNILNNPHQ